jgi:hypothetical protein
MSKTLIESIGEKKEGAEKMMVNSFYGGDKNGAMIQFTVGLNYAMLTRNQVLTVANTLLKWAEETSKVKTERDGLLELQCNETLREFDALVNAYMQLVVDEVQRANDFKLNQAQINDQKEFNMHKLAEKMLKQGVGSTMMWLRIRLGLEEAQKIGSKKRK